MYDELRTELLHLMGIDQDVRDRVTQRWPETTPIDTTDPLYLEWITVDAASTARLKEIVAEHGWPGRSLVGDDGANAAWLLLQHSPDHEYMQEGLELLRAAVADGEASPKNLAYLEDRVLMHSGRPQVYGTQSICRDGTLVLWDLVDATHVNDRRAAAGLEPL